MTNYIEKDMMENTVKQSRIHSLLESVNAAAFAAPTAMLLHKATLMIAGDNVLNENQDLFVFITWIMFFLHSIAWKYILRRVYDHYGVSLDPRNIYKKVRERIT